MVIPLSVWYPEMHQRWLRDGVKQSVPLESRTGWTVHHTDGGVWDDPLAYARFVARMHFEEWNRPGGYNVLVGLDAVGREMTPFGFIGAHAPTCNRYRLGLAFQGSYARRTPSESMLNEAGRIIRDTSVPNDQNGHRDCSSTTCPGSSLYRILPIPIPAKPEPTPDEEEDDIMADPEVAKALNRIADGLDRLSESQQVRATIEASKYIAKIRDQYGHHPDPHSDVVHGERIALDGQSMKDAGDRLRS